MEFWLGKLSWAIFAPSHLTVILLLLFSVMPMARWLRSFLCCGLAAWLFFCMILPVGDWALVPLEQCQMKKPLPATLNGAIVLGGAVKEDVTTAVGDAEFNSAVDRLLAMMRLMKTYPQATIIYSGGSGDPMVPNFNEAFYVKKMIREVGLDADRIIAEDQSRNTADNAKFTQSYFARNPEENWLIVTSAYHMPRSLSLFRQLGAASRTHFYAYPADYKTTGRIQFKIVFDLARNLKKLDTASKEYMALAINKLLGRSKSFLPCGEM